MEQKADEKGQVDLQTIRRRGTEGAHCGEAGLADSQLTNAHSVVEETIWDPVVSVDQPG